MGRRHVEYDSCVGLIKWWAFAHRSFGVPECLLVHIPNQAAGGAGRGFHLKKMGVRPGIPDYLLLTGNALGAKGLFIEMKSATGKLSPEQKAAAETLTAQGYWVRVCRSAGEARQEIESYIKAKSK